MTHPPTPTHRGWQRLLVAAVVAVLAMMLGYVLSLNGQLRRDYETEHETLCFAFPTAEHCE